MGLLCSILSLLFCCESFRACCGRFRACCGRFHACCGRFRDRCCESFRACCGRFRACCGIFHERCCESFRACCSSFRACCGRFHVRVCVDKCLYCVCCGICRTSKRKEYEEIDLVGVHTKGCRHVSVIYSNHEDELRTFCHQLKLHCQITTEECKTVQEASELQIPLLLMFRRKSDRPLLDLREALENVADNDYPAIRLIYVHNYTEKHLPCVPTSERISDTPFSNLKGIFDFAFTENKMYDCQKNTKSLAELAESLDNFERFC